MWLYWYQYWLGCDSWPTYKWAFLHISTHPRKGIPDYDDIFRDSDDDEDEDEDEEGGVNVVDGSGEDLKRKRFDEGAILKRRERRLWDEKRSRVLFEYQQFSYYGEPTAMQVGAGGETQHNLFYFCLPKRQLWPDPFHRCTTSPGGCLVIATTFSGWRRWRPRSSTSSSRVTTGGTWRRRSHCGITSLGKKETNF